MGGTGTDEPLVLSGRFRCDRLLKGGGGAHTWLATDLEQEGRTLVVKTVADSEVSAATSIRLEHEAQVLRRLNGSGPRPLVAWGRESGVVFLVQPFVEGVTLRERLAEGPLDVSSTLRVATDVLRTLQLAHAHDVLHRDVKPANVIVDEGRLVHGAVLIDFGLAQSAGLDPAVRDEPVGTARYLAPEAAGLIELAVDERADLYSLGILVFECLAGRPPFEGTAVGEVLRQHLTVTAPPLRSLGVSVPRALDDVIARLLRKDPDERYQSAAAVLADIADIGAALERGESDPDVTAGSRDHRRALTEPAFVGRSAELATLAHLLDEARRGNGGLVLLESESGGGKTRLLDELALQAGREAWILRGQGVDHAAQRPFQLLEGVSTTIAGSVDGDPAVAGRLKERLGDWTAAVVSAIPELAETLGEADPGRLGPEAYGEVRSIEALRALVDALGQPDRPALVILDDCQWADGLTARLLARWEERRASGSCHVLVVAAFRSEEVGPEHALRAIRARASLALGSFTPHDVEQLCASMAGALPDEAVATILRLAEGSPFMASAVLRGMVESGALHHTSSGWEVEPTTMADVQTSRRAALFLVRRLELLSPAALGLLSVGAVLGKEFDLGLAVELAGLDAADAQPALVEARRRRILWVDETTGRCAFSHDKLREGLLQRLDGDARRDLHRRAARRLENTHPDRVFELAYHFDAGGEGERALGYALRAAEQARPQHAMEVAAAHYRIAQRWAGSADKATRAEIAEGLGDVLTLQGDYGEAASCLAEALTLTTEPVRQAELEGKLGDVAFKRGEPAAARRYLEGAVRHLGRWVPRSTPAFVLALLWEVVVQAVHTALPRLVLHRRRLSRPGAEQDFLAVRMYSRLAYVYWFHSGKVTCGWAHLREMNLAERYPPTLALAQAYSEHAPVMTMVPWYRRGIAYCKRSLAIRTEFGDLWGQGQSLAFYGVVLYAATRYRESIDACREAIRLLQRTGDRWEENTATWHLAFAQYRRGELDTAVDLCRRLHAAATEIDDSAAAGISLSGWSRASGGEVPAELTRAGLARHLEDAHTETEIHVAEAVRLLAQGDFDQAVLVLRAADRIVRRAGLRQEYVAPVRPWTATALRLRAEALPVHAVADRRRALREAARASRRAVRIARRYRNNGPHAYREQALVASLGGRPRRAERLFARSIALADRQGARYERALTEQARARVGTALGWPGAAAGRDEADAAVTSLLPRRSAPERGHGAGEPTSLSMSARFEALLGAGRRIASAPSEEAVFSAVEDAALTLLRGERCHVVAIGDTLADPTTISSDGVGEISRGLIARAVREGVPVVASEGSADVTESMVFSGVRSSLCAPIRREGRTVACFSVTHRQVGGLFGDEEVRLAEFVATLAGAALEHVAGSEARYRSLALNSTDVVTIVATDGVVSYQSSSVAQVFGFDASELAGRPLASWLHPDDAAGVLDLMDGVAPGTDGSARVECRLRHRDGSWRHVETVVTNLVHDQGIQGIVLNTRDVTERVTLETELRNQAWHDSLTGLANRALFTDRVTHAIARQSRQGGPLAVLFLDLDDFKALNDTMGHAAGDLLLLEVGKRLETCVRPGDTVARFGGDEFALLLEAADPATAETVAARVLAKLSEPFPVLGREVRVRVSVGIAAAAGAEASVDELLGNADAAMYVAKTRGKDRYEIFETRMRTAAVERSGLRTDLLWAVERNELVLHYQPVVEVASGKVVGFEALLRWRHPDRGLLLPDEFIGLAEESGLIVPIGAWVTREACLQAKAWNVNRPTGDLLTMAVNLSVRQLQDAGLVAMVSRALMETRLDPAALILEITESATVRDTDGTIARLQALESLGVGLAIDDFGTGYSPLSYLRHFPVSMLKIDRSFVAGLGRNAQDSAIVSSVIGLAHAFDLRVVAEGVETVGQLEALTRFGCDYAQGYNWRRPASSEEADRWLEAVVADHTARCATGLRVVLADDRSSVRAALRLAMDVHGGFVVVGEAADGRQAIELAARHQPDLVVLDLAMPGYGGLEALPGIRSAASRAGVVLLTALDPADVPAQAVAQTLGLLDKTSDLDSLVDRLAGFAQAADHASGFRSGLEGHAVDHLVAGALGRQVALDQADLVDDPHSPHRPPGQRA